MLQGRVRRAEERDIPAVTKLLVQVNMVHHILRPDIFNGPTVKYSPEELAVIFKSDETPVFVFETDGGEVVGHAFCMYQQRLGQPLFTEVKSLYIDDICVDENHRGMGVASALYDAALALARENDCYNVTLNVWEGNEAALRFYRSRGMKEQRYTMEEILTYENGTSITTSDSGNAAQG